jgi:hypothetical protein
MPRTSPAGRPQFGNGAARAAPSSGRLTNLEAAVKVIQQTLEIQFVRMAAMQAELDHLAAKKR